MLLEGEHGPFGILFATFASLCGAKLLQSSQRTSAKAAKKTPGNHPSVAATAAELAAPSHESFRAKSEKLFLHQWSPGKSFPITKGR
jgi:hypothetical protein